MAGHFRNSAGNGGIMGYVVFSFTVNHLISIFLVFLLPSGILPIFSPVLPVQPGNLQYKKWYEIAVFLYRSRCRYEKFQLYQSAWYGIDFTAFNTTFKYQISQQFIKLEYEKIKTPNTFLNSLMITKFTTLKKHNRANFHKIVHCYTVYSS